MLLQDSNQQPGLFPLIHNFHLLKNDTVHFYPFAVT